mgnify:CR=1 FL=1
MLGSDIRTPTYAHTSLPSALGLISSREPVIFPEPQAPPRPMVYRRSRYSALAGYLEERHTCITYQVHKNLLIYRIDIVLWHSQLMLV